MPNWCQNTLTVTGDEAAVRRFITANSVTEDTDADRRQLSFECAVPTPPQFLADGSDGWYDWRVNTWGTKWDAAVNGYEWEFATNATGDVTAELSFDTAWSPPIAWLGTVGEQFPDLLLRMDYIEHGNGYSGYAVSEEGYFGDHETTYEQPDEDDESYYF